MKSLTRALQAIDVLLSANVIQSSISYTARSLNINETA